MIPIVENYKLILNFPDKSVSYKTGFEAGMAYSRMLAGEKEIEIYIHNSNVEIVKQMALQNDYCYAGCPTADNNWYHVTAFKADAYVEGAT